MKKLLEFLILSLVENPKEVVVEPEEGDNFLNFKVQVHPDDLKNIIGKQGKTIKAIRKLLGVKARRRGQKIYLTLLEEKALSQSKRINFPTHGGDKSRLRRRYLKPS